MAIADKAVWVIERNSGKALTLPGIAEACGVSRSHLALAFGTAAGLPVMKYLRARRLTESARTLARGANDILSVALEAGYNSHEAFTRAFREQFGTTPETVREQRSTEGLTLITAPELRTGGTVALEPPRIHAEELLRVVGLSELCSFATTIQIPAQWQRFMTYHAAIPARLERMPLGLSRASGDEGQFEYICAVEVSRFGDVPKELLRLEIPARTYAVFEHRGHVSTLTATYRTIWNEALPALGRTLADAPVLERHHSTFDPRTGEGGLALWVPLAQQAPT